MYTNYEKTLVILKPDAVQRKLSGEIITRFEKAGLKIHAMRLQKVDKALAKVHYEEHKGKVFYEPLLNYITSSPVVVLVIGGIAGISKVRTLVGATEPASSAPGTIRGDYSHQPYHPEGSVYIRNLIHASANIEDATREVGLWFNDDEIIDYDTIDDTWLGINTNE
jgi:nucleoside-diphosphate kinase